MVYGTNNKAILLLVDGGIELGEQYARVGKEMLGQGAARLQ
jgi:hypothetical protein